MAEDDEESRRKRRREREDEIENEDIEKKKKMGVEVAMPVEKIEELLSRLEPLIAQVDNLYGQYLRGMEKNPPLERRKQLDSLVSTLNLMPKNNTDMLFRYNGLHARYISSREKWDRIIRDLESGKIKRLVHGRH